MQIKAEEIGILDRLNVALGFRRGRGKADGNRGKGDSGESEKRAHVHRFPPRIQAMLALIGGTLLTPHEIVNST